MTTGGRVSTRRPIGEVGLLDTDYLKDRLTKFLPKRKLERPLVRVRNFSSAVSECLGEGCTVAEALKLSLCDFAKKTGLSIAEAAKARRRLLGIPLAEDVESTIRSERLPEQIERPRRRTTQGQRATKRQRE